MSAGRPRKPIVLLEGHKTKDFKNKRAESEAMYGNVPRALLVPPEHLTERAKTRFEQIVNDAFWLDELSVDLLTNYCYVWDRWMSVSEELLNEPETFAYHDEVSGEIKLKANPNRRALIEYGLAMQQLSAKLGLGNIDRLKLIAPDEDKSKNKFAEFVS